MKKSDGRPHRTARMTLERVDSGTLELGGCGNRGPQIPPNARGSAGRSSGFQQRRTPVRDRPARHLASTLRADDVGLITTPASICLDFKHME
jgi:hypothetical protein